MLRTTTKFIIITIALLELACQPKSGANLHHESQCPLSPEESPPWHELETRLLRSLSQEGGLDLFTAQSLVAFIIENRKEYTSLNARITFNLSEAGCLEATEEAIVSLVHLALDVHADFKTFSGDELGIWGLNPEQVEFYVQMKLTDFYWDYGIYWFLIKADRPIDPSEQPGDVSSWLLDNGVDD